MRVVGRIGGGCDTARKVRGNRRGNFYKDNPKQKNFIA